jgi:hypothetical protein
VKNIREINSLYKDFVNRGATILFKLLGHSCAFATINLL